MTSQQTPPSKIQRQVFWVQDQKPAGSGGGASTTPTNGQIRDLNTVRKNTITGASLNAATGEFTLPVGTYRIIAFGSRASTNNEAILTIFNETTALRLIRGPNTGISNNTQAAKPVVMGDFEVTDAAHLHTIRQINVAATSGGLGESGFGGELDIYTDVLIEKVG